MKTILVIFAASMMLTAAAAFAESCPPMAQTEDLQWDGRRAVLIVERFDGEGDLEWGLKPNAPRLRRQEFLRASCLDCYDSARAQMRAVNAWNINGWRCEIAK